MKYKTLESMFDERVRIVAKNANLKTMMGGGGGEVEARTEGGFEQKECATCRYSH